MGKREFQILISTMEQYDTRLLTRMGVSNSAVVINQVVEPARVMMEGVPANVTWLNINEHGLSKSRNMAISSSDSDICLLADDDEVFCPQCEKIIISAFERLSEADILAFQVYGIEKKFKKYKNKQRRLRFFSAMKTSSVQIAFRRKSIERIGIRFDERFGAGSKYFMGEENIFLSDCLRQGLKMFYVPEKIADLHMNQSSWNNGFGEKYFISRGAQYYRMSKRIYPILIIYFSLHIYMKHKGSFKLIDAWKWMNKGVKECKGK